MVMVINHSRENQEEGIAGVLLVDKPAGLTSFKMVQQVRRATSVNKVGHAGTLDPFATGLLVIGVGRPTTRLMSRLMDGEKEYIATLRLGIETETQDLTGRIVTQLPVPELTRVEINGVLQQFVGESLQIPPRFSALKFQGKPLYFYARKGILVEKGPRPVIIKELTLLDFADDSLVVRVRCSKGTYIRTLAEDIGRALGCGAHLTTLRRIKSGSFSVHDSLCGQDLADREKAFVLVREYIIGIVEITDRLENS